MKIMALALTIALLVTMVGCGRTRKSLSNQKGESASSQVAYKARYMRLADTESEQEAVTLATVDRIKQSEKACGFSIPKPNITIEELDAFTQKVKNSCGELPTPPKPNGKIPQKPTEEDFAKLETFTKCFVNASGNLPPLNLTEEEKEKADCVLEKLEEVNL